MSLADDHDAAWRGGWPVGLLGRFFLLGVGLWLHAADTLVTATLAPAIVDDIGGVEYLGWLVSVYQVGTIIASAAAPAFCRSLGIRRVQAAGVVAYAAGCVVAASAPNMATLLVARFVQGAGGGALISVCYFAIQHWFPAVRWSRMFGILSAIWGTGSLLGPLIGGLFADSHAWRPAFWLFAGQAGVLLLLVLVLQRPEPGATGERAPWPLAPLLLLSAATLVIAVAGVGARVDLACAGSAVGLALLYAAARIDRQRAVRLLPRQILEWTHPVGAGLAMVMALAVGTTGFWTYGPLLLKTLFGVAPLVSGYIFAGEAIAWSIATVLVSSAPVAADRVLIRAGVSIAAAGAAAFTVAVPAGSLPGMVACALLQGIGFGMCWPSIVHRLARFSTASDRPLAAAAPGTVQRIGYAVGTAAVGIAANLSGLAEGASVVGARRAGFWVFAAFVPVLLFAVASAWRFTARAAR
jgi:MFS family permease